MTPVTQPRGEWEHAGDIQTLRESAFITPTEIGLTRGQFLGLLTAFLASVVPGVGRAQNQRSRATRKPAAKDIVEGRPSIEREQTSRLESVNWQGNGFYTQAIETQGIIIKAPQAIDSKALERAKEIIDRMLGRAQPEVVERMVGEDAQLAIIPQKSFITVLPEFSHLRGRRDPNGNSYDSFAVRGTGAVRGKPVTATSEENLLKLRGDPFAAEDITVHEVAHAVHNLGLTEEERRAWDRLYRKYRRNFQTVFAGTNKDEFFAELTQSCFECNNEIGGENVVARSAPEAHAFLQDIYKGKEQGEQRKSKPAVRGGR